MTRGFVVQNIVIIIVELIVSVPDLHMEIVLKLDKDSPHHPPLLAELLTRTIFDDRVVTLW